MPSDDSNRARSRCSVPTKSCPRRCASSTDLPRTARARSVNRSAVGAPNENRLWAACLLTPRAALISDHERPLRRHWSTKWPSSASVTTSTSATVLDACESWSRGSSPPASVRTMSISSCRLGEGGMRQLYIDACDHRQPSVDGSLAPDREGQSRSENKPQWRAANDRAGSPRGSAKATPVGNSHPCVVSDPYRERANAL